MAYPTPSISSGGGYSYQTHIYSSSGKGSKKEGKDEEQHQSKSVSKVAQREMYEESVVSTKKIEKQQEAVGIPTNQKN